ncbi:MAG: hypothetical protein CMK59_07955 [Proteobacteria bacterium]|nr:hypothetical protein [Pseudomonadota bacterium]
MVKLKDPNIDRVRQVLSMPFKAAHLAYRVLGPQFQSIYHEHQDLKNTPSVFVHGNPHLDNFVRTFTGVGMVDFDRSRIGPYSWDIVRFLGSLQLYGFSEESLSKEIIKCFLRGYKASFKNPDIFYSIPSFLQEVLPKTWQMSMSAYISADKKWAKKLNINPVDKTDPKWMLMLVAYLKSRKEHRLLNYYQLTQVGTSPGSLGKLHILLLLEDVEEEQRGPILIDLKETYCEDNTPYFFTPTDHHGLRMIKAANLYAPNVEQRLGYFSFEGEQFWGREIPSFNAKIKVQLSEAQQEELGYMVGSQLGRAHRLSLYHSDPDRLLEHLSNSVDSLVLFSEWMVQKSKSEVKHVKENMVGT